VLIARGNKKLRVIISKNWRSWSARSSSSTLRLKLVVQSWILVNDETSIAESWHWRKEWKTIWLVVAKRNRGKNAATIICIKISWRRCCVLQKLVCWMFMQFRIDFGRYGSRSNVIIDALTWPLCNIYHRMKWNVCFCDDYNVSCDDYNQRYMWA
jgi:5-formyltetrahydrofolate cyclo-ligase